MLSQVAFGVAALLVTFGVALIYIPAALIVGGAILGIAALFVDDAT